MALLNGPLNIAVILVTMLIATAKFPCAWVAMPPFTGGRYIQRVLQWQ